VSNISLMLKMYISSVIEEEKLSLQHDVKKKHLLLQTVESACGEPRNQIENILYFLILCMHFHIQR
jgi:hypothetical protein